MIDIKNYSLFRFKVDEGEGSGSHEFKVARPRSKTVEDIIGEAASIYYWGMGGWQQAWPLTFTLETIGGLQIATASVFNLTSSPTLKDVKGFDVILLEGAGGTVGRVDAAEKIGYNGEAKQSTYLAPLVSVCLSVVAFGFTIFLLWR